MSFTVEAVLNIRAVLRTVLCAVRIKLQKEIIFLKSSALLYDQILLPRTISSSIGMPEFGYNTEVANAHIRGFHKLYTIQECQYCQLCYIEM